MSATKPAVLVTGANGQLGQSLQMQVAAKWQQLPFTFVFLSSQQLNITQELQVQQIFAQYKPCTVINCAAYTQVDKAETEQAQARLVNCHAAALLAYACKEHQTTLIQISTDFVFDGTANTPYAETDPCNPLGVYAQTKFDAEQLTIQTNPHTIVVRTSWVFSPFGHNFVKTMLRLGKERPEINVVYDQIGSPTYAPDLADALLHILLHKDQIMGGSVFHFANTGVASWYDLAVETIQTANLSCRVNPILTQQYPTPAHRPPYSVLHTAKIRQQLGINIPYWRNSLQKCLQYLSLNP